MVPISCLQLVQLLGVADSVEQQLFEFVVALQRAAQVREPGSQIEQFLQRLHLLGHIARFEVFHLLEVQIDLQLRSVRIFAQLVLYRIRQVGLHALKHGIEVVGIDFHELAVLEPGEWLFGIAGKFSQHSNHKGQFFQFDRSPDLYIVGNLNSRGTHTIQLVLCACSGHRIVLFPGGLPVRTLPLGNLVRTSLGETWLLRRPPILEHRLLGG